MLNSRKIKITFTILFIFIFSPIILLILLQDLTTSFPIVNTMASTSIELNSDYFLFSPQESSSSVWWPTVLVFFVYCHYLYCINFLESPEELNTNSESSTLPLTKIIETPVPALEVPVEAPMSLPPIEEPLCYFLGTKACSYILIFSILGGGSMLLIYVVAHAVVIPFLGAIEQHFVEDAVSTTVKELDTSSKPIVLEVKTTSLDLLNTVDPSTLSTITDIITKQ